MKDKLCVLNGGKEICGGYHQALHVADHRVVMNINQMDMEKCRTSYRQRCGLFMISDGYKSLVTFIVANKRHHTRAFLDNPRDGDSKGNVKPGTVIDSVVVDPHRFDFYLWGHSTLQGISRPCHYTVLYDDNNLSAKDVQQLTYHLGYTFSRSTHSVSVVTPVYYANEAAAHARHFLQERTADTETTVSSGEGGFKFAHVHEAVLDRMFFI
ncbi:Ribonuclease H-like domain [Phytophthora cactorum]|nr:Ribonuclease H-like domain [Phytophthora cactorum]